MFDNLGVERAMLLDSHADGAFEEAIFYRPDGSVSDVHTDRDGNGWFDPNHCVVDYEIRQIIEEEG